MPDIKSAPLLENDIANKVIPVSKEAKKFICDKPNNIRGSLHGKIDAYIDMYNYVRGLKNKNTSQSESILMATILDTITTNLKDLGCYNLRIMSSDLL